MNSAAIDHSKITLLDYCNLAFLNGVHHWCGSSVTDDNGNRKYTEAVVSFDMSHEVCGSIKLPNGVFNKQSPTAGQHCFFFYERACFVQ